MRELFTCDGATGRRYAELAPELLEALPRWMRERDVAGGEVLKERRVWRWREYAVKLFARDRTLRARLRSSPAVRAADMHFRLLPVASPRPFVALDLRRARALECSLLVSEFVAGRRLDQLWRDDARAVLAFPQFFGAMHVRGIFHGDFHTGNALWNGREWVLLDLEGVRHRLRSLMRRRLAVDLWARVLVTMGDERRVRELFESYRRIALPRASEAELWKAVRRRRDALAPEWGYAPLYL